MIVACLPKACIHNYYHGVRFFKLKDQDCNAQNRSYGKITNNLFETYKVLSRHMESICFRRHLTWKWKKCVHIHNQNMLLP